MPLWNDQPSNTSLLCCKIRLQKRKVFHFPSPNPVGSTAPGPAPLLPPLLLWYPLNIHTVLACTVQQPPNMSGVPLCVTSSPQWQLDKQCFFVCLLQYFHKKNPDE